MCEVYTHVHVYLHVSGQTGVCVCVCVCVSLITLYLMQGPTFELSSQSLLAQITSPFPGFSCLHPPSTRVSSGATIPTRLLES